MARYAELPNLKIMAANGVEYAYRETGEGSLPLVMLMHFRGNLDSWDPALVDALSQTRKVITFDNIGVGGTSGQPSNSMRKMAHGALAFISAMGYEKVDLLGFSIGSFVAQEISLIRPDSVRKVVLASSAPQGAPGMHGWEKWVMDAVGKPQTSAEEYVSVFFAKSESSHKAGMQALGRMHARTDDRDKDVTWEARIQQYDAVCEWGVPNHALLERVAAIEAPVFIANGDSDPMITPQYSHLLRGLIPQSTIKIYDDSAHGFLFQYHDEFAADVSNFLAE